VQLHWPQFARERTEAFVSIYKDPIRSDISERTHSQIAPTRLSVHFPKLFLTLPLDFSEQTEAISWRLSAKTVRVLLESLEFNEKFYKSCMIWKINNHIFIFGILNKQLIPFVP